MPIDPYPFEIGDDQEYLDIEIIGKVLDIGNIENTKIYGDIKILKVDAESGEPLANTKFELYDSDMHLLDTILTDEDGIGLLEHLVYGQYFIKEVEVPFPYVIDKEKQVQQVFISEKYHVYKLIFSNQTTSIKVAKIDKETKEPIANTIFNLYDPNKNFLTEVSTDSHGLAIIEGYGYGHYYIEEVFVPEPYILNPNNKLQEFELSSNNNNYEVLFENEKALGRINLIKVDSKNSNPISDVIFNLYDVKELDDISYDTLIASTPIDSKATNVDGNIEFTNLDISKKYALIEVESKYGYKLSKEVTFIDLKYVDLNTPVVDFEVLLSNDREDTLIKAVKKDKADKSIITDDSLVLELKDSEGNIINPKSFKDGIYTWETLALETYYINEKVAPKGYINSKETIKVDTNVESEDNIYRVDFYNSKMPVTGISNNLTLYLGILLISSLSLIRYFRKSKNNAKS